ncbi:MAG: DNA gyrase inhibitor YacG [Acidobacteria bacterium]|nr:MAG: DNA gyrase inhibitor YacG [Acidobacteriota bacterium]PYY08268.1 MAG: DNA gyrase inhibitor YacG [Acidobacteriota bacterium]
MSRKRTLRLRCPSCKKPVKDSGPEFPFCSERCRLIDLGKWASGSHVISSPLEDTSDISSEVAPEDDGKRKQ